LEEAIEEKLVRSGREEVEEEVEEEGEGTLLAPLELRVRGGAVRGGIGAMWCE